MKLYEFQRKAISDLVDAMTDPNTKETIKLKSPTGSGKTVIMINFINEYLKITTEKIAFIWLCPGKGNLEEQSMKKMQKFAPMLEAHDLPSSLLSGFKEKSTTFINWEMITKTGNRAITESENKNLYDRIYEAHDDNIKFVVIIDEEHLNNTSKADSIISALQPFKIIRVSATTLASNDATYIEIKEDDVINEGLITKAIYVNDDIETEHLTDEKKFLIEKGDECRKKIVDEYKKLGVKINPLVVIQLANGNDAVPERVEEILENMGYNYDNGMLAIWLANKKINLDNINEFNSPVSFVIIKQAIATGWDCPRAKVLVKLREASDENFEIQTVGRIRRMPELHHYNNNVLDNCYVFTFDEKYKNGLFSMLDKAYKTERLFIKSELENENIKLVKENKSKEYAINLKETIQKIHDYMIKNYNLKNGAYDENLQVLGTKGFNITDEIETKIMRGKYSNSSDLENVNDTTTMYIKANTHFHGLYYQHALSDISASTYTTYDDTKTIIENLFCDGGNKKTILVKLKKRDIKRNSSPYYAFIINNADKIKEIVDDIYSDDYKQGYAIPNIVDWTPPKEKVVKYDPSKEYEEIETNGYKKYSKQMLSTKGGIRSTCEIKFEQYLNEKCKDVEYYIKNGDSGPEFFSIVYRVGDIQKLFFPDYIVITKSGNLYIIETKGGESYGKDKNIDKMAKNKFDALKRYANDYDVKFGFVRDDDTDLYISNTEYTDKLKDGDGNWKKLGDELACSC